MFGDVVCNIKREKFEHIMDAAKVFSLLLCSGNQLTLQEKKGAKFDSDLNAADLKGLIPPFLALFKKETGHDFPTDPAQQVVPRS